MPFRRKLRPLGLAAGALCLAQFLAPCAQGTPFSGAREKESAGPTYRIHIPGSTRDVRVAWELTYLPSLASRPRDASSAILAGWEVTLAFDPAHCDLYCTYRRKPGAYRTAAAPRLLPPVAAIRIYASAMARPLTVVVDPAGLGRPAASRSALANSESAGLPGKKRSLSDPPRRSGTRLVAGTARPRPAVSASLDASRATTPLRV